MTDGSRLVTLIAKLAPDEVYNLAAQSNVCVSFDEPEYTGNTVGLGTTRLLEAIRITGVNSSSIKHHLPKYLVLRLLFRMRRLLFIRARHTVQPRFIHAG